jgi:DNA-binding transcriptional regulator YdaS (Cro superfamily)
MQTNTAQTRTLKRAASIAGSEEKLAQVLGCELAELRLWLSGEAPTPPQVYLRALDIVSNGPR